ncbi:MAG: response regulator transcription factor [Leptolyngbyaceae cyanobacterium MAG.088]|nr:response regulator transcription factor [Leptolyngbyaceae cyanobacterium MAG.088]
MSPTVALTEPVRVLLVDDEDLVRYALRSICEAHEFITVVGEAADGEAAIAQAQRLQPDVVLMDIGMPVLDGVNAMVQIHQMRPQTKVLILTVYGNDEHLIGAIQHGAAGYLLKNTPPEDVGPIICATHKGYLQIGPTLGQKLCQQLKATASPKPLTQTIDITLGITPREREVLALIAEGANNREIAQILHIAEKTVKNHVSSLLSRVGVRDRTQLALWQTQVGA